MSVRRVPIKIPVGINKQPDNTNFAAAMYTDGDKVRFNDGYAESIGGWSEIIVSNTASVQGISRTNWSTQIVGDKHLLIGTHSHLYHYLNGTLTNISPLVTSGTTLAANPLQNYYVTLGADPVATVDGSTTVTISYTAHPYQVNDAVTISGVGGAVNGVPASELNAAQIVRSVSANSFTITVTTAATGTGSGGGASVVVASGLITVTDTAHGFADGDRIKLTGATAVGGILAAEINVEHIIRNVQTNTYDIFTDGVATSSATGGGASVDRFEQIAAGSADTNSATGFGAGAFGTGAFGAPRTSATAFTLPRIWSFDRYGNSCIMTPGNDGDIYSWDFDTAAAPVKLTNSPTANFVFVSDAHVIALGADGVENKIAWCDQDNATVWTPASTNFADTRTIQDASRFLCAEKTQNYAVIWDRSKLYRVDYVGGRVVFTIEGINDSFGIIAQNARQAYGGRVYWRGSFDFYMYDGNSVQPIGGNTESGINSIRNYSIGRINTAQQAKCFAWFNEKEQEIWFHYPSGNEVDSYDLYDIRDNCWSIGTLDRTSAVSPRQVYSYPILVSSTGTIYAHEQPASISVDPVNASVSTNKWALSETEQYVEIEKFLPDVDMTGTMSMNIITYNYPADTGTLNGPYTITQTTDYVGVLLSGLLIKLQFTQNAAGARFRMGKNLIEIQSGEIAT